MLGAIVYKYYYSLTSTAHFITSISVSMTGNTHVSQNACLVQDELPSTTLPLSTSFPQASLDRAGFGVQRHFGERTRELAIFGGKVGLRIRLATKDEGPPNGFK